VSFDAVAPWYYTLEWIAFGNALQRCRIACLDQIANPRRVLIVGEGNGRFLFELLRHHPGIEVDCVDSSEGMSQLAQTRVEALSDQQSTIRWLRQDIVSWDPPRSKYDLIVTHFLLDCFPKMQLETVVKKLGNAGTENAEWLLADFRVPSDGKVARMNSRIWLAAMYQFFRLTAHIEANKLIDPTPFFERDGFSLVQRRLSRQGMLKSELWRRG